MIPYFIMIVWTITVTVCVARNTTAINTHNLLQLTVVTRRLHDVCYFLSACLEGH